MKQDNQIIRCPYCEAVCFDGLDALPNSRQAQFSKIENLKTLNGDLGWLFGRCVYCNSVFEFCEHVVRTWETRPVKESGE